MFIATFIAAGRLKEEDIQHACELLRFNGQVPTAKWLEEGTACDIFYDGDPDFDGAVSRNDGVAAGHMWLDDMFQGYDIVIQPAEGREKKLLVADMDSTMITVECIDELADYAGIKAQIAEVTERAMRGELDFGAALDARVALLKDLEESAIDRCLAERVKLMPGAKTLVRTMKARGATTILVSGGFTRFAEPVGAEIGFDRVIANVLEIGQARLTGTVTKPIVDSATKETTLLGALAELGLPAEASMAVGDGANDLAMIRQAGLGVAYHAKPIVAAAAGARIDHGDLTALLYAQGIARSEWIDG
ncbi:phosphoserine phosphatase SerB [Sphingomonas sp. LM7]|uniref:phosphoserine phosphatase SerB n=1 Tax=Sphingomonas sp. LM7 TaxID=1938607 RepID=UPI000983FC16|nr:phosphoserine phosphatase SerB [Sphingomonas sp. LM7]AQR72481.1 phosphoserine phosphatase SerB [Sphingomonas sp. LM7]